MKTNYYFQIQEYLKKCEKMQKEGKDIPRLELEYPQPNGFKCREDVAKALTEVTQNFVSSEAIEIKTIPLLTDMSIFSNPSSYLHFTQFTYRNGLGFFKIRVNHSMIYFYSPLYTNNSHILAEKRNKKIFQIIFGLFILIMAFLMLS